MPLAQSSPARLVAAERVSNAATVDTCEGEGRGHRVLVLVPAQHVELLTAPVDRDLAP